MANGFVYPLEKWAIAEQEYVSGKCSIRDIADRHGIRFSTITARATRMKWAKKREGFLKAVATPQPVVIPPIDPPRVPIISEAPPIPALTPEFFLRENEKYIKGTLGLLDQLEAKLETIVKSGTHDTAGVEQLESLIRSVCQISERRRIVLGIPTVSPIKRDQKPARRRAIAEPLDV